MWRVMSGPPGQTWRINNKIRFDLDLYIDCFISHQNNNLIWIQTEKYFQKKWAHWPKCLTEYCRLLVTDITQVKVKNKITGFLVAFLKQFPHPTLKIKIGLFRLILIFFKVFANDNLIFFFRRAICKIRLITLFLT